MINPSVLHGKLKMNADPPKQTIMVVDDTPANLKLLDNMLRRQGYRALAFPSGDLALNAAAKRPPDLILLDVNMPGMDGFEVCRRLKADKTLAEIPVLFISGRTETKDKVRAFAAGGVDYVTKPFQFEEVYARVQTHLELSRQKKEQKEAYDRLREMEALRDSLVHMIVHDLRSPLTAVMGYLELVQMADLSEETAGDANEAAKAAAAILEMVNSMLLVSKMESGKMKLTLAECDLAGILKDVKGRFEPVKGNRRIILQPPEHPVKLTCDRELLTRTVQNLLANAVKVTDDINGAIHIIARGDGEYVHISVTDNGPGIPAEYHQRIFEKFAQVDMRKEQRRLTTGLGLTFCKLAVEAHGGRIGLDSEPGRGSTFWFELPVKGSPAQATD